MAAGIYDVPTSLVDDTARAIVEAQMMVVSFTTSILNYALTDAYYDAGLADVFKGMPPTKFRHDDARSALREAWAPFSFVTRMNLDLRYRYVVVNKLMSPPEGELWHQMEEWSERVVARHWEYRQPLSHDWASFVIALGNNNPTHAGQILAGRL